MNGQLQQMRAMMAQMQQQQQVPQQQTIGPTGMVQQQQQVQPQPQRGIDFNNPDVVKQWRNKIANDPVKGLADFVKEIIQVEGQPILDQVAGYVNQTISPLQQAYLEQTVGQVTNQYAQTKTQDPSFQGIQPIFQQVVAQAVQRGVDVRNPANLGVIEQIARTQAANQAQQWGYNPYVAQQAPQNPPFTERPGPGQKNNAQQTTQQLSVREREVARGFGMTESEYSKWARIDR